MLLKFLRKLPPHFSSGKNSISIQHVTSFFKQANISRDELHIFY